MRVHANLGPDYITVQEVRSGAALFIGLIEKEEERNKTIMLD